MRFLSPFLALPIDTDLGRSIIISDIGLSVMVSLLIAFGVRYGWTSLLMYYFIPYVVRCSAVIPKTSADALSPSCAIIGECQCPDENAISADNLR